MRSFYSHGKLLLTGEYAVLKGAKALAVPCKKGQILSYKEADNTHLRWRSIDFKGLSWFEAEFDVCDLKLLTASDDKIWKNLVKLLQACKALNPSFLKKGGVVETKLEFNRLWGLGSSSTLVSSFSQWANVNPYQLLKMSFGGSGYDIACAQATGPIIYKKTSHLPEIKATMLNYPFSNQLYFIYLNQKRDSQEAVAQFNLKALKTSHIEKVSIVTEKILETTDLNEFNQLLKTHEEIIAELLNQRPIQEDLFSDFDGTIKSLGAWGGDFILASSTTDPTQYFTEKGYEVIIPFKEMILETSS